MVFGTRFTKWQYIRFASAALFCMFLGSQTVHSESVHLFTRVPHLLFLSIAAFYMPLKDMDKFIEEELKRLPEEQRKKIKL
jgi:hypothetical protein